MRALLIALLLPATFLAADARLPNRTALRVAAPQQSPPLDPAAFRATIDGAPAPVRGALGPQDDLILLVVLDLTGEPALVDTARAAMVQGIEALPPNQWVGVLRSQDALQVVVDPTPDRQKPAEAIRAYAATGRAGLLTTLESAASLADSLLVRTNVRVAVLYVTDSNIYNYREDFTNPVINATDSRDLSRRFPDQLIREKMQKMSDQLAAAEAPLFVVHLNYFSDPINEAYQRGLMQLAENSGGLGAFCRSRGEISDAIARVISAAGSHWMVEVELGPSNSRTATVDLFNGDRDIPNRSRFSLRK